MSEAPHKTLTAAPPTAEPVADVMSEPEGGALPTLDVVVPLFNEAEGIETFHAALVEVLQTMDSRYLWCVVYVVDPSPDGTAERVRRLVEADDRVRALLLLRRAGHQMSLIAGMERSTADIVITMDGDLQHPPSLIPTMLDLYETGVDVVQTVRFKTDGQGWIASALSRGFYRLMGKLSEVRMVPGGADFRLMSARVVEILCHEIGESDRFLRGLIPWLGLPTATLEFTAPARELGRSKYSFSRSMSLAVTGVVSFSKVPLHLGIVLGLVVGALGLVAGIVAGVMRLSGADIPAGWATLVVMVAILSGMQMVTLGLIGLYLGVIFDEAKRRPQILVSEAMPRRQTADGIVSDRRAAVRRR
jgi:glycosyltransferase involved in cell wall biosynthesis